MITRQYEVAGTCSHLPKPIAPQDAFGAIRQNPADFSPVVKAVFANLVAWIRDGDEPPASSEFIEGTTGELVRFQAMATPMAMPLAACACPTCQAWSATTKTTVTLPAHH